MECKRTGGLALDVQTLASERSSLNLRVCLTVEGGRLLKEECLAFQLQIYLPSSKTLLSFFGFQRSCPTSILREENVVFISFGWDRKTGTDVASQGRAPRHRTDRQRCEMWERELIGLITKQ